MSEDEIRPECRVLFDTLQEDVSEIKGDTRALREALIGPGKSVSTRVTKNETMLRILGIAIVAIPSVAILVVAIIKLWY